MKLKDSQIRADQHKRSNISLAQTMASSHVKLEEQANIALKRAGELLLEAKEENNIEKLQEVRKSLDIYEEIYFNNKYLKLIHSEEDFTYYRRVVSALSQMQEDFFHKNVMENSFSQLVSTIRQYMLKHL